MWVDDWENDDGLLGGREIFGPMFRQTEQETATAQLSFTESQELAPFRIANATDWERRIPALRSLMTGKIHCGG